MDIMLFDLKNIHKNIYIYLSTFSGKIDKLDSTNELRKMRQLK